MVATESCATLTRESHTHWRYFLVTDVSSTDEFCRRPAVLSETTKSIEGKLPGFSFTRSKGQSTRSYHSSMRVTWHARQVLADHKGFTHVRSTVTYLWHRRATEKQGTRGRIAPKSSIPFVWVRSHNDTQGLSRNCESESSYIPPSPVYWKQVRGDWAEVLAKVSFGLRGRSTFFYCFQRFAVYLDSEFTGICLFFACP